jgi:hypothetical protein
VPTDRARLVLAWLRPSAPALSTSKWTTSCLSHNTCYLLSTKLLRPLAGHTAILHSAGLSFLLGGLVVRRVAEHYHSSKHWVLGTIPQMSDFCRYLGVAYRCELPASSTPTQAVEWRGENGVERLGKPLEYMNRAVVLNVISTVISGVSSGPA